VRAVVHTAMPKSIEAYQQETGRAGRDGLPAECVLLYSAGDLMRWKRLIESPDRFTQQRQDESGELPSVDPQAAIALQLELLDTMQRFAGGTRCRHKHLCGYFGQELETDAVSGCGACDACLGDMEAVPDAHDIARKIISCVARINKSGPAMGAKHTIEVLRGAHTEGITRRGHDKLPTHGLLRQVPVERLRSYIDQLIDQSGLMRSGTEYPVLDLGDQALPILRNETTAVLVEPRQIDDSRRTQRDYTGKAEVSLTPAERDLFEALRRWRRELSAKLGIPPFTVFSDATLEELCQVRPSNRAALGGVKGIGDKKADQFGDGALDIITETCRVLNLALDAKAGSRTQTTRRDRPVRGVGGGGDRTAPDASADAIDALGMSSGARAAKPFFDDCMAIGAVCDNLGRKPSTVYAYLTEYIQTMKPRDIDAWVKPDEYQRVAETIRELGPGPLRPIYDRLAAEPQGGLSFDVIRLTMSHMQACKPR